MERPWTRCDFMQTLGFATESFGRPFMGGVERKGVIATGRQDEVLQAAEHAAAMESFPMRYYQ